MYVHYWYTILYKDDTVLIGLEVHTGTAHLYLFSDSKNISQRKASCFFHQFLFTDSFIWLSLRKSETLVLDSLWPFFLEVVVRHWPITTNILKYIILNTNIFLSGHAFLWLFIICRTSLFSRICHMVNIKNPHVLVCVKFPVFAKNLLPFFFCQLFKMILVYIFMASPFSFFYLIVNTVRFFLLILLLIFSFWTLFMNVALLLYMKYVTF